MRLVYSRPLRPKVWGNALGSEVYVEAFDGMEALIVDHKNGQRIEVPGNPDLDGPLFRSSPVASIKEADPVAALARLARKPGDTIALSPLDEI